MQNLNGKEVEIVELPQESIEEKVKKVLSTSEGEINNLIDAAKDINPEELLEFDINDYLDNNGLIQKWEASGMYEGAKTNFEKFLIASMLEAMIYNSFYMEHRQSSTSDDVQKFQDKYLQLMAAMGMFNGQFVAELKEDPAPDLEQE